MKNTRNAVQLLLNPLRVGAAAAALLLLAACAVGPDYVVPQQDTGVSFKSAQGWVQARPGAPLASDSWWQRYQDPLLNELVGRLNVSNQTLAQAVARYDQAVAATAQSRSSFFPTTGFSLSGDRAKSAAGIGNSVNGSVSLQWEADLWGKLRRQYESSRSDEQASRADVAAARLSMQSTLAQQYFALRMLDERKRLLQANVRAYERSVQINQNRYDQGVAARADVVSAQAQLESARASAIAIEADRNVLEHAIAVLIGQPPASFAIEATAYDVQFPSIPVDMPSTLLLRRPDIVAAERRVAAANAQIGVAQSAWFPDLTLGGSVGNTTATLAQWLASPLQFWSLGPALAMTVLDGGARAGAVDASRASYRAEVATYRQTVLTGLQEVEDAISTLRVLERQQAAQMRALTAARQSLAITQNQYLAGLVDYLSVVQVQSTAYSAEQTALQLESQRLQASVQLIAALGGGWDKQALQARTAP